MRHLLFLCLLPLFIASCNEEFFEQTIEIDPPAYDKQLVAHTLAGNLDSLFALPLTRNFGILDPTPDSAWAVKNALVEIYEDGQLKLIAPPSPLGDRWYIAPLAPGFFQAGKSYELRASHPDFPTMTARQTMPGPFQIDSTGYRENAGISADGSELSAFDVYLKDQAGVRNYYVMWVEGLSPKVDVIYDPSGQPIGFDTTGYYAYHLYAESPEDPNVRLATGSTFAVSDQFFDGQGYKFSFRTYRFDTYARYRIHVQSVTEDYFLYTVSAQRKADVEDLPLVEPVTVYDNMDQGIGIFGLGWEEVRELE